MYYIQRNNKTINRLLMRNNEIQKDNGKKGSESSEKHSQRNKCQQNCAIRNTEGEPIRSKVSQKERNKYHMLTHIYEIQENATDGSHLFSGQEQRHRHREQTQDTAG